MTDDKASAAVQGARMHTHTARKHMLCCRVCTPLCTVLLTPLHIQYMWSLSNNTRIHNTRPAFGRAEALGFNTQLLRALLALPGDKDAPSSLQQQQRTSAWLLRWLEALATGPLAVAGGALKPDVSAIVATLLLPRSCSSSDGAPHRGVLMSRSDGNVAAVVAEGNEEAGAAGMDEYEWLAPLALAAAAAEEDPHATQAPHGSSNEDREAGSSDVDANGGCSRLATQHTERREGEGVWLCLAQHAALCMGTCRPASAAATACSLPLTSPHVFHSLCQFVTCNTQHCCTSRLPATENTVPIAGAVGKKLAGKRGVTSSGLLLPPLVQAFVSATGRHKQVRQRLLKHSTLSCPLPCVRLHTPMILSDTPQSNPSLSPLS